MALIDECEMLIGNAWTPVGVTDVLKQKAEGDVGLLRCHECHGAVCAHKESSTGTPAHFEHLKKHAGCSTKPKTFSGTRSFHFERTE